MNKDTPTSTAATTFELPRTTADTNSLASRLGDGMVLFESVFYAPSVTSGPAVSPSNPPSPFPLQGLPVTYIQPFEPVAATDWEAGE